MKEIQKMINEISEIRSKSLNDQTEGIAKCILRELASEEQTLIKKGDIDKMLFEFCTTDILPTNLFLQKKIERLINLKYKWIETNQIIASKIFCLALTESFGDYDYQISHKEAILFSHKFFDFFAKENSRYFSTTEYSFKGEDEYSSAKGFILLEGIEHTIICFDKKRIGCISVSDHD